MGKTLTPMRQQGRTWHHREWGPVTEAHTVWLTCTLKTTEPYTLYMGISWDATYSLIIYQNETERITKEWTAQSAWAVGQLQGGWRMCDCTWRGRQVVEEAVDTHFSNLKNSINPQIQKAEQTPHTREKNLHQGILQTAQNHKKNTLKIARNF